MQLESKKLGGKLGEAVETHTRLVAEELAAIEAAATAEADVKDATEQGERAAVTAKLEDKPVVPSTRVEDAEKALRAATYDVETSRRAVAAALDRLVTEAQDPAYAEKLEADEAPLKQTALNYLTKLESTLDALAEVRAYRAWLARPVKSDRLQEPTTRDVWIGAESMRHPNGEHARSRDLTKPLREALQGETARINSQQDWGMEGGRNLVPEMALPAGATLSGPWGAVDPMKTTIAGAAARAFQELIGPLDAEAEEVPA
jgi:hypothetical protein